MLERFGTISIKSILKYSAASILIIIPLYPKFPIITVPGTFVAVRAEDFLISFLAIIYLIYFLKVNKLQFIKDRLHSSIFLFIIVGLISVLSAAFLTQTVSLPIALLHWARRIEYLIPFFIAYAAVRGGANTKYYLHTLLLVGFLAFLYGWGQIHLSWPVITTQNEEYAKGIALRWTEGARLSSTFAGHYDLAGFLVMLLPISLAYFFYLKNKIHRAFMFFFYIFPVYWLFLQTEARVSFAAYLLGLSFTLWFIRRRKYILPVIFLSILGMFVFSSLGARYIRPINAYKSKIFSQVQIVKNAYAVENNTTLNQRIASDPNEDRSFSIRLNVEWPRAVRAFLKNPLLGTGYSSISLATDNDYLRLLGEIGLVGTLAFFLVLMRIIEGAKRYLDDIKINYSLRQTFVAGFFGGFVGFIVNALFIDVFEASKAAIIFWTLSGIAVALVQKNNVYKNR